jgi:hypothetical protein
VRPTVALVGLLGTLLLAGCSANIQLAPTVGGLPQCTPKPGKVSSGTLVMAQAVPSAQWLPCVREVPVGWSFDQLEPRDGQATFDLDSDRDGTKALTVLLGPSCDTSGATEIPSEHPDMRRYERADRVSRGYAGQRYYVFSGGCVTYQFDLRGATRAEAVATVSEALGFVSRAALARQLYETSGGRLVLDVTATP